MWISPAFHTIYQVDWIIVKRSEAIPGDINQFGQWNVGLLVKTKMYLVEGELEKERSKSRKFVLF